MAEVIYGFNTIEINCDDGFMTMSQYDQGTDTSNNVVIPIDYIDTFMEAINNARTEAGQ